MLQGLVKSAALVTRLAHGVKNGMDWRTAREPLASLFYNRKHHIAKAQHAVERTRELFAKSLGYVKPEAQGDYAIAQHFLNEGNADADAGSMPSSCTPPLVMTSIGRKRSGGNLLGY
ncbi:glycosyltransferase family 9 protein [Escherichia coli]